MLALAQKGHEITQPADLVKDPLVLEFAGFRQDERFRESDLEQALISKLQQFLLELGKGFAFMGRQQRITLDSEHFFIDLVFYNRLTRSYVLLDLKVGKLTHQDLGQMQMYVNYYQRELDCPGREPAHRHRALRRQERGRGALCASGGEQADIRFPLQTSPADRAGTGRRASARAARD